MAASGMLSWPLALLIAKKIVDLVPVNSFQCFLPVVFHMISTVIHGSGTADACRYPLIPGVMMDGHHNRCFVGSASATTFLSKFKQTNIGIVCCILGT